MSQPAVTTDRSALPGFGLRLVAGLLIWVVHLSVIYAASGLYCARPSLRAEMAGLPWLGWLIGATTLIAVAALVAVALTAFRGSTAGSTGIDRRFFDWVTLAVAGLSLLAVVWQALPLLIVPPCA